MRSLGMTALALLAIGGCAGPSAGAPSPGAVAREPIHIDVDARRAGTSLHLNVVGTGRGHREREAFEDPRRWVVRAESDGRELRRVLNGPARIAREPVGHPRFGQWNVVVRFSLAFALPDDAAAVRVYVEAPDAAPFETTIREL